MPCYQIQTVTVAFKVASKERLVKSLYELGFQSVRENGKIVVAGDFTFDLINEKVTAIGISDRVFNKQVNAVKRKYSFLTIQERSQQERWINKCMSETEGVLQRY